MVYAYLLLLFIFWPVVKFTVDLHVFSWSLLNVSLFCASIFVHPTVETSVIACFLRTFTRILTAAKAGKRNNALHNEICIQYLFLVLMRSINNHRHQNHMKYCTLFGASHLHFCAYLSTGTGLVLACCDSMPAILW